MKSTHYIPRKDIDFASWTGVFLHALGSHLARLRFPEEEYGRLTALYNDFLHKYETASNPSTRTKLAVQDKNDARSALEKTLQQDVKEFLTYNRAVSDADRDNLGLPIHKSSRTPAPVATTYPDYEVDSSIIRRLTIRFIEREHRVKARPHGQRGVVMQWVISDTPPVNLEELPHTSVTTRSPFTLEFQGHERGKTVYFALCWENTRGEKGPFGPIAYAVIP
ncbi:MAG: hypothetical protein LBB31_01990 [Prevotellaceae bacterium]|jgi:hypothetical protein|nr:hypothetical protein [Prevotellaceae bacterium]